jgi:hypothetical protein
MAFMLNLHKATAKAFTAGDAEERQARKAKNCFGCEPKRNDVDVDSLDFPPLRPLR